MEAKDWLHAIERIMVICDIDRDMWIQLAISMFQGDARLFWEYCVTTGKFRQFSEENVQMYVYNNLYYLKSEIDVFILCRIY